MAPWVSSVAVDERVRKEAEVPGSPAGLVGTT